MSANDPALGAHPAPPGPLGNLPPINTHLEFIHPGESQLVDSPKAISLGGAAELPPAQVPAQRDPVTFRAPQKFGETPEYWKAYDEAADKHDQEMVKGLGENVDVLLVFAGLFSAVNTAFIVLSLAGLQAGPADQTNALLKLLVKGVKPEDLESPPFVAPNVAIRVNCFFAASLACSLMAAFGAMLGKQWVGHYARTGQLGPINMQGRHRQMKFTGVEYYHFRSVVEGLPTLLQIALLLFFIGLIDFFWSLNNIVASVVFVFVALGFVAYIYTVIAATRDQFCPFQTPVSTIARRITTSTRFRWSLLKWWLAERKHLLAFHSIPSNSSKPSASSPDHRRTRPTRDSFQPTDVWEDGDEVDAASAIWVLETSAQKEALLAAARNYVTLYRMKSNDALLQGQGFKRLVSLLKDSLSLLKVALNGPATTLEDDILEPAIIYGRALCHSLIGKSSQPERRMRDSLLKELADFWPPLKPLTSALNGRQPELGALQACLVDPEAWVDSEGIDPLVAPLYIANFSMTPSASKYPDIISKLAIRSLTGPKPPSARVLGLAAWSLSVLSQKLEDAEIEKAWDDRWNAYTNDGKNSDYIMAALNGYATHAAACEYTLRNRPYQDAYTALLKAIRQLISDDTSPLHSDLPPLPQLLPALKGMLDAIGCQLERCGKHTSKHRAMAGPQHELLKLIMQLSGRVAEEIQVVAEPLWHASNFRPKDPHIVLCTIQLMKHTSLTQQHHLTLCQQYPAVSSLVCDALLDTSGRISQEAIGLIRDQEGLWFNHDDTNIHQQLIDAGLVRGLVPHINSSNGHYILCLLLKKPLWREKLCSGDFMDHVYTTTLKKGESTRKQDIQLLECERNLEFWLKWHGEPDFEQFDKRWLSDELATAITSVFIRAKNPDYLRSSKPFSKYSEAVKDAEGVSSEVKKKLDEAMHRKPVIRKASVVYLQDGAKATSQPDPSNSV